jgi:hypothetical protein
VPRTNADASWKFPRTVIGTAMMKIVKSMAASRARDAEFFACLSISRPLVRL